MACQADMDVLDDFSEVLLNFGAELNEVDVEGHSALHFCSLYGRTETAKTLVRIWSFIIHFILLVNIYVNLANTVNLIKKMVEGIPKSIGS